LTGELFDPWVTDGPCVVGSATWVWGIGPPCGPGNETGGFAVGGFEGGAALFIKLGSPKFGGTDVVLITTAVLPVIRVTVGVGGSAVIVSRTVDVVTMQNSPAQATLIGLGW
jgi:hypothetical protein